MLEVEEGVYSALQARLMLESMQGVMSLNKLNGLYVRFYGILFEHVSKSKLGFVLIVFF